MFSQRAHRFVPLCTCAIVRKGLYPGPKDAAPKPLGLEAAGVVAALPAGGSKRGFKVGDRVMTLLSSGGYAEYVAADERHMMKVPEGLSLFEAAGVPETWMTAFQLLHLVAGNLEKGKRVLIHGAASGVGTSAIQLVLGAGGIPLATAGSEAKLRAVQELGVREDLCFNRKDNGGVWSDAVLEALEKEGAAGVDIVLDPVGGTYWDMNAKVLAVDSSWVLYGFLGGAAMVEPSGSSSAPLLASLLRKRVKLQGTTLKTRSPEYKAELRRRLEEHAASRWASGEYAPVLDKKMFPLDSAQEAHEYMESNANQGKIVLYVKHPASPVAEVLAEGDLMRKNQARWAEL